MSSRSENKQSLVSCRSVPLQHDRVELSQPTSGSQRGRESGKAVKNRGESGPRFHRNWMDGMIQSTFPDLGAANHKPSGVCLQASFLPHLRPLKNGSQTFCKEPQPALLALCQSCSLTYGGALFRRLVETIVSSTVQYHNVLCHCNSSVLSWHIVTLSVRYFLTSMPLFLLRARPSLQSCIILRRLSPLHAVCSFLVNDRPRSEEGRTRPNG